MNLPLPFKSRCLVVLCLVTSHRFLLATGIEDPTRWLGLGTMDMLEAPEFFFELEAKRIARDLDTGFKANVPPGIGSDRTYRKQTDEADLADFEAAIKAGDLRPPDPEKAQAAHKAAIKALKRAAEDGGDDAAKPSPEPDLPSSTAAPAPRRHDATRCTRDSPRRHCEFPSEFADYHRGAVAYHGGDTDAAKNWKALLGARPPSASIERLGELHARQGGTRSAGDARLLP